VADTRHHWIQVTVLQYLVDTLFRLNQIGAPEMSMQLL